MPPPPPPTPAKGASGQQLVVKGAGLRSPWAPKAPEENFVHFAPQQYFNPTLTRAPTPSLSLSPYPTPTPRPN